MSITSHSNTLSFTRPHDIPGKSLACCMPFSWRAKSPAAPVAGAGGMLLLRGLKRMYVSKVSARECIRGLGRNTEELES
jgi:hypothetical protein